MAFIGAASLGNGRRNIAISRDGKLIVYAGVEGGVERLFKRPVDSYEVSALSGTDGAYNPFFSPTGRYVGFFAGNQLKTVSVDGGDPIVLAEVANPMGADWGLDNRIVYSGSEGSQLLRVSADGGPVEVLRHAPRPEGAFGFLYPQLLPGGDAVLVTGISQGLAIVELNTDEEKRLRSTGTDARYVASGHLLHSQGSVLFAARFDLDRREVEGQLVPVLSGIRNEIYGASQWGVSDAGTLVYATGGSVSEGALVWVGRDGSRQPLAFPTRGYGQFQLSPDGTRLAIEVGGPTTDIWIYDLIGQRTQKLTAEGNNFRPMWSPDGTRVVFRSDRDDGRAAYSKTVDAGGQAQRLLPDRNDVNLESWSNDGRLLAANVRREGALDDVAVFDLANGAVYDMATTPADDWGGVISPDGRAIAYTSDESGEFHIYLQPIPPTELRRQVSVRGGSEEPVWARDGTLLYYRNGQRLMAAPVTTEPELSVGTPVVVFEGDFVNIIGRSYDVAPDGERFLIIEGGGEGITNSLQVVQGWFSELARLTSQAGSRFRQ